jgi:hypothetical protein
MNVKKLFLILGIIGGILVALLLCVVITMELRLYLPLISDQELIAAVDRMTLDHGETMIWVPSAQRKNLQGLAVGHLG